MTALWHRLCGRVCAHVSKQVNRHASEIQMLVFKLSAQETQVETIRSRMHDMAHQIAVLTADRERRRRRQRIALNVVAIIGVYIWAVVVVVTLSLLLARALEVLS